MAKTNGDMFRSMTNQEIADFMYDFLDCGSCPILKAECNVNGCEESWIEFLEREASEDA